MSLTTRFNEFIATNNYPNDQEGSLKNNQPDAPANTADENTDQISENKSDSEVTIIQAQDETIELSDVEIESNLTTTENDSANSTVPKLPVVKSVDIALTDLSASGSSTGLKFLGDFQAYRLQQALPSPPKPPELKTAKTDVSVSTAKQTTTPAAKPSSTNPAVTQKAIPPPANASLSASNNSAQIKATPMLVSQYEAKVFVEKFGGNPDAIGKELSFKLISPLPAEKDLVRATLIYMGNSMSQEATARVANRIINNIPTDGLLRAINKTPEGVRSLSLTRAYLNIDGVTNRSELERINKALSDTTVKTPNITSVTEEKITATRGQRSLTLQSVSPNYKPLTPEKFLSGDSNSLAAIAIGSAEGNRTITGGYNPKTYNGHFDPNNKKINIGSFSKQTSKPGTTPQEADREQLTAMQSKIPGYIASAKKAGLDPNNPILLANYLDLYNQASPPKAEKFLKLLPNIAKEGISNESILRTRVKSFYNDKNEPTYAKGLFGNEEGLKYDQIRRMNELTNTLNVNGYITIAKPTPAPAIIKTETLSSSQTRELATNEIPKNGNPEIRYQLPTRGEGYVTYNRNDTNEFYKDNDNVAPELVGKRMPDQIGTRNTIERLQTLGKEWNKIHPDKLIQIGDISLPGGVDTRDHETHQTGRDIDIRPFRDDDKLGNPVIIDKKGKVISKEHYDPKLTTEFIRFVLDRYPNTRFYFIDKSVETQFPKDVVKPVSRHDNHLHIIFSPSDDRK